MPNNRTKIHNGLLYYGASSTASTTEGNVTVRYAGIWDGTVGASGWTTLDDGIQSGYGRGIYVVSPNQIYVFGKFSSIGSTVNVSHGSDFGVARWDGTKRNALGTLGYTNDEVKDVIYDSVNDILYVCGEFTQIYGVTANGVAQFDGVNWTPLQGGTSGNVHSMTLDSAQNLYVCGSFYQVSNGSAVTSTRGIAKWDYSGQEWVSINGISSSTAWDIQYNSDDNSLYACGSFSSISGVSGDFDKIARYSLDDSTWYEVGGGIQTGTIAYDLDIANGKVFVGGQLSDGSTTGDVMVWDGIEWTDLGYGKTYLPGTIVFSNFVPIDLSVDSNEQVYINRNAGGFFILSPESDTWVRLDNLASDLTVGFSGQSEEAPQSNESNNPNPNEMCYCQDAVFYLENHIPVPILELRPGHRIIGKDNEVLTVRKIFKMPVNGSRELVKIEPGFLNNNVPDKPITLSLDHEIWIDGKSMPCHQVIGIQRVVRTVRDFYHIQVDCPGILKYAKTNGGLFTDVWGNDNRLVK